jgi:hypothetical protein
VLPAFVHGSRTKDGIRHPPIVRNRPILMELTGLFRTGSELVQ